ncbi:MAG: hypothetical protein KAU14_07285, partial [Thermoplasmata archaeon]|nr:hypothetical protein [Thermoplasmata archaeon]
MDDATQDRKPKPKKRLTPERTYERIISLPILQISAICFFIGLLLSAAYALVLYDPGIDSPDDITFFMRQGGNITLMFYYILACFAIYIAASMAYRVRFKEMEDGTRKKRELEFPQNGIQGVLGFLNAAAPLFFLLLLLFGIIGLILGFHLSGEDVNVIEKHTEYFINGIFGSFFIVMLPATLVFVFMSEQRGLKRMDKHIIFLILLLIFAITALAFRFYWYADNLQYMKDIDEGKWLEAEISEFTLNYAVGLAGIFELCVFCIGAFIMSNLKFRRKHDFKLDLTPGMIMFITGAVMFLISIVILLTIFNTDFDYTGDTEGYAAWFIFLDF